MIRPPVGSERDAAVKAPIKKGIIAISQKGRDKGRPCMVLYEVDADFVFVADGDLRKLAKPKKKRRKHLASTSREEPGMLSLYELGRLKDSDLRQALQNVVPIPDAANKEDSLFGQE